MNTKKRLINRLRWYYPLELAHAVFTFPMVLLYVIFTFPIQEVVFLAYGIIVCIVILFQGQHYWKIKLKRLRNQRIDREKQLRFFRKSKKLNVILILLIPIVFMIQAGLLNWEIHFNRLLLYGFLANLFAVLEHINYFHTQLMIDNSWDLNYVIRNKKLKKASLANDLRRNRF